MKLTVLMDNSTYIDQYYLAEPAVSYLIEDGERTILFDAGYSGVFIENAERMKIDLGRVTDIVLSHGHIDHTGGLPAFFQRFHQPVRLTAHPNAFQPKQFEGLPAGSPISLCGLPDWVEQRLTAKAVQISEHVLFLGEIPRVYPFEEDRAVGETLASCGCCWESDTLRDDSSLALNVPGGVFTVCGCAHSGVCSTVPRQKSGRGKTALRVFSAGSTCSRRGMYWIKPLLRSKRSALGWSIPDTARRSRSRRRLFARSTRAKSA